MKKKISLMASMVLYLIAIIILIYYFSVEFNELLRLSPTGRIVLLLSGCLFMYFGGLVLTKYIDKKYKNKVLKINIGIWFILYIILLSTLTLFDDYFFRGNFNILNWNSELFKNYMSNSFNLIPFKTIFGYITKFISGDIAPYIFIYNILGNAVALMPFAFFLPILLKKQKKFKNFLVTMICIVICIELLQFITMSGCCDIDDVILNVVGALVMFGILRIKSINQLIRNIFLLEKNKIDYKDLVKKIIIILIPIICIIGVVFISENKYIDKNSQTFTHLKIIDKTKEENITCNTALEQFYEDKEYIYYFPCEKSKYVIVIYSNGYQETVKSSLEYGDITIEDLEKKSNNDNLQKFSYSIYNNCIPHIDDFTQDGYTKEEHKMINETRKILNKPHLPITATAVRVPVVNCHGESINVEFEEDFDIYDIKVMLQNFPGIIVVDDPEKNYYPLASKANGNNEVFVGRIRRDFSVNYGINLWVVADNLRKGAATNAVQILEKLIQN